MTIELQINHIYTQTKLVGKMIIIVGILNGYGCVYVGWQLKSMSFIKSSSYAWSQFITVTDAMFGGGQPVVIAGVPIWASITFMLHSVFSCYHFFAVYKIEWHMNDSDKWLYWYILGRIDSVWPVLAIPFITMAIHTQIIDHFLTYQIEFLTKTAKHFHIRVRISIKWWLRQQNASMSVI